MKIKKVSAREIIDSRGNPTVEATVFTEKGSGWAAAPSGASRGAHEAWELRDGGERYMGKGVLKAVKNVNKVIGPALEGMDVANQEGIDKKMIELDGTKNKSKLGGNAIVAVSMAVARAAADAEGKELYEHFGGKLLPVPMLNIVNGGQHAGNELAIQEFMVIPVGAPSFSEGLRYASEVYHTLREKLKGRYGSSAINVGDEGGFAPPMKESREALDIIVKAVEEAGYGKEIVLGVDCAASGFYKDEEYHIDGKRLSAGELLDYYAGLLGKYPLESIEDPFQEEDFSSFAEFTGKFGGNVQVVADDLTVSNPERLKECIERNAANALLLKINQVGTVTEAMEAKGMAEKAGMRVVVSHRSGETEDPFIADFAVGTEAGQIKAGAPARGERTAKYNRLLAIEGKVGNNYAKVYK